MIIDFDKCPVDCPLKNDENCPARACLFILDGTKWWEPEVWCKDLLDD